MLNVLFTIYIIFEFISTFHLRRLCRCTNSARKLIDVVFQNIVQYGLTFLFYKFVFYVFLLMLFETV